MEREVTLKRSISWLQGTALTVGAVLGSGVLVLPVLAAEMAGPASMISWILMGLLTVPLVIVMGNLAGRWPEAGGIAAYAQRAFGRRAGTITGWLFLGTVPIGAPVAALIGAGYIGAYFSLSRGGVMLIAALMLALAIVFNYRGITLSGRVQLLVVSAIALILLVIIVSALPGVEKKAFIPLAPHGWAAVGSAMTVLFWAFVGWEMIGHLAEEFKNPRRDIQLSLGISLVVINILYIMLAFVIVGTGAYLGEDRVAALAHMVYNSWGREAGAVVSVLGFIVCYGTIHTYVAGFSRLVYAQARQGDFPSFFSVLHPVFRTPHRVLLTLAGIFSVVMLSGYWHSLNLTVFIQLTSAIFIALYVIGMAAAIKLLKGAGASRCCAVVSLVVCLIVYGFNGWLGLYPLALGAAGWYAGHRQSARAAGMEGPLQASGPR